jgi:hypothetical protein
MFLQPAHKQQLNAIFDKKSYLLCLHKRIALARAENFASKTKFDKNEIDILCYQTKAEIQQVTELINIKQAQFFECVL